MSFLQELFGPSRDAVWAQLAAEVGGRFDAGSWFVGSKVQVDAGPWTVTLDTFTRSSGKHSTTFTRLRAPYANSRGFRFSVAPENFLSGVGRFFGMQDIEIGDDWFDKAWVVQGADESRVKEFLRDPEIRKLLAAAGPVSFEVQDDRGWFGERFPEGVDELVLTTRGVVKDLARLKVFFALFAATLDRLVELGQADRRDPGVS
jgi:hypothetical protein